MHYIVLNNYKIFYFIDFLMVKFLNNEITMLVHYIIAQKTSKQCCSHFRT